MEELIAIMQQIAAREAQRVHTTELGIVTAVFPHADEGDHDNYQCSIQLRNKKLADGSPFELRKVPVATPYMGLVAIPNVGDLVVVSFIGGDMNAPVIMGRVYNDEDRPPPNLAQEFLLQHSLTEGGSIKLDAEGRIIVTSKSGENVVTIDDETISLVNEKFSLVIDINGQKITVSSEKDVTLIAKSGKLTLEANEVAVTAKGKLALEGNEIAISSKSKLDIAAGGALKLQGSTIDLN